MVIDIPGDGPIGLSGSGRAGQLLLRLEGREEQLLLLEIEVDTGDRLDLDVGGDGDRSSIPAAKVLGEVELDALEEDADVDLAEADAVLQREETSDLTRMSKDLAERKVDDSEDGVVLAETRVYKRGGQR